LLRSLGVISFSITFRGTKAARAVVVVLPAPASATVNSPTTSVAMRPEKPLESLSDS
jgi:hypothetical protein